MAPNEKKKSLALPDPRSVALLITLQDFHLGHGIFIEDPGFSTAVNFLQR